MMLLYARLFSQLERPRWSLVSDVPWERFSAAAVTPRVLEGIKMNALLEWSALPTAEMFLRDNPGDADFAAFVSIWFYEEQKHSLVLMEYLRRFAPELAPSEDELAAVRFAFDPAPRYESLALHFCAEVRLNQWYRCAERWHREPVIKHIYHLLACDEARHGRAYLEYMRRAIERDGDAARLAFLKIGLLMSNTRWSKAMHPTNLHVNKSMYPSDRICDRLPDAGWLERWLSQEIGFDQRWERRVSAGILHALSNLLDVPLESPRALRDYRRSLLRGATDSVA